MYEDMFDLVCLFYSDANSDTVDTRLDEDFFILITGDGKRIQQKLWRGCSFDFRYIVSFRRLRCEVGSSECGGQGRPDTLKVGSQRLRLRMAQY